MNPFVALIWTILCFCSSIKAQTHPEAGLVKIGQPWNYNISLPTSDNCNDKNKCGVDLCGVQANIRLKWNKAPLSNGESKIKLTVEHTNFRENKTWSMTIPNVGTTILKEEIDICLSKCPTYWNELDKRPFTFNAAPEDMEEVSIIDVEINTEKSVSSECETKPKEQTTPLDDEKKMSVSETLDEENEMDKEDEIVKEDEMVKDTEIDKEPEIVNKNKNFNENEISVPIITFYLIRAAMLSLVIAFIGAVVYGCRPRSQGSDLPLPATAAGQRSVASAFLGEESRSVGDESSKDCTKEAIELSLMEGRIDRGNKRSGGKKNKKED